MIDFKKLNLALNRIEKRPASRNSPVMSGLSIPAAYYMKDGPERDRMMQNALTELRRDRHAHAHASH